MTTEELIIELKTSKELHPKEILEEFETHELTQELIRIFTSQNEELKSNPVFYENYTQLINYVYLLILQQQPERRDKTPFTDRFISSLLNLSPAH